MARWAMAEDSGRITIIVTALGLYLVVDMTGTTQVINELIHEYMASSGNLL